MTTDPNDGLASPLRVAESLDAFRAAYGDTIPESLWRALHQYVSLPYVEVLLTEVGGIWLVQHPAGDPQSPGQPWYVPGGYWRTSETLEQAVDRIGATEIGISSGLSILRQVGFQKWVAHPRGPLISHLVHVMVPRGEASLKGRNGRFFSYSNLPTPMVEGHADMVHRLYGHHR